MKTMLYAGIGSRRTPQFALDMMTVLSEKLEKKGYTLRSGGAVGADKAFEAGVVYDENKEIFLSKHATKDSMIVAADYHPYWDKCELYARKLHGRNAMIMMGQDLEVPVDFVICYTPDGKDAGGTGLGMRMADDLNIPIFNLFFDDVQGRMKSFLDISSKVTDFSNLL